jgi:putative nucleotidyltransferase with HDIG domain
LSSSDPKKNPPNPRQPTEIRLSEVLSALSYALDLTEGQPEGHGVRSCFVGMSLALHLDLDAADRSALFYALLLKDLGCSSNAAKTAYLFGADDHGVKRRLKTVQWSSLLQSALYVFRSAGAGRSLWAKLKHVARTALGGPAAARELIQTRCERGADIARQLGFPEATAQAILDLDEHWDGKGHPLGKRGEEIFLLGRILGLAQTVDVFFQQGGADAVRLMLRRRQGGWFDPALVDVFLAHVDTPEFWQQLAAEDLAVRISDFEPGDRILRGGPAELDRIAAAFARVIDAKSPYTAEHSARVAEIVAGMADQIGMNEDERRALTRAALLHDIGKLGVSNLILDKAGKLTDEEWARMRAHTDFTYRILSRVNGFSQLAEMASAHHERLDGRGYHRGVPGGELPLAARLLAVADQYEAMTADRPYRQPMPTEQVLGILADEVGRGIDGQAYGALSAYVANKAEEE